MDKELIVLHLARSILVNSTMVRGMEKAKSLIRMGWCLKEDFLTERNKGKE